MAFAFVGSVREFSAGRLSHRKTISSTMSHLTETSASRDRAIAFAILRLTLGLDIFLHGMTRMPPHLGAFAEGVIKQFANTPLPEPLVRWYAFSLPFAEAALGFLLILGLWTRFALIAGGLLILSLVFGTALRSEWQTVGLQMIYAVIYYLLLAGHANNGFSLDRLFARRRPRPADSSQTP